MSDRYQKFVLDLVQRPGNSNCADCLSPNVEYTSFNLGIFLCEACASIHRSLGVGISKVKSIKMDNWSEDQVKCMEACGNLKAREKFEQLVPTCYKRPRDKDPQVLREQWIRAKYERLEFMDPEKQTYLAGFKEGYLMKRGKDDKKFQRRRFVLSETDNTLKYYNKEDAREPKATLRLDEINAVIVPEKVGNPNAMQITFEQGSNTRSLFLQAETGKEIVDWFTSIRSAKLNRLTIAYPGATEAELAQNLTHSFLMEGWLSKTGPRQGDAFRRRWFTLERRKLMYYDDPMDAFPKGEIFIGHEDKQFAVRDGLPPGIKSQGFCFTLKTPDRHFHLSAEVLEDKTKWMQALESVISQPLSPQDSSSNFGIKQNKKAKRISVLNLVRH
ncbi:hypothetical protein CAPTEDRAFT_181489 [Capitella teleta]|uniref:Arf-GAP with dual PH domain-containing protein 1 n=1 Tax=Capitella teleta TaxID=283909 RepID=R7U8G8_CAPTE|nr:hypothetical protein CAPTEDRAFT_181489 [Capitella teleta]|eukprot:ELT99981.1 hypothetical protein CAPTEDRAFT_181489 [Capitella teleta]